MTSTVMNFGEGKEIIGIYGRVDGNQPFEHKFDSIGFIMNNCTDEKLADASQKSVRRDPVKFRGEKLMQNEVKDEHADDLLTISVVFGSVIISVVCLFWILVKFGCICGKSGESGQNPDTSDFDSVNLDTPSRKVVKKVVRGNQVKLPSSSIQMSDRHVPECAIDDSQRD